MARRRPVPVAEKLVLVRACADLLIAGGGTRACQVFLLERKCTPSACGTIVREAKALRDSDVRLVARTLLGPRYELTMVRLAAASTLPLPAAS